VIFHQPEKEGNKRRKKEGSFSTRGKKKTQGEKGGKGRAPAPQKEKRKEKKKKEV